MKKEKQLKSNHWLLLCLLILFMTSIDAQAQLFGKKRKKSNISGFVIEEAQTPEDRQKAIERQL
ncbi:MAG TPA: hypothetical protein VIN11_07800, partial [Roseivirga sp.]